MKKTLSVLLAILTICSILTGLNITAYANTINTATNLSQGVVASGTLSASNKNAFYKISIPISGKITFYFKNYNDSNRFGKVWGFSEIPTMISNSYIGGYCIYDQNKDKFYEAAGTYTTAQGCNYLKLSFYLCAGTYYIEEDSDSNSDYYGNYELSYEFESCNESFIENYNNRFDNFNTAKQIEHGKTIYGQLSDYRDYVDMYKFTLTSDSEVTFTAFARAENGYSSNIGMRYTFYDNNQAEENDYIWRDYFQNKSNYGGEYGVKTFKLSKGIYYIMVDRRYTDTHGFYNFKVDVKSWQYTNGKWYLNINGKNATGWQQIDGTWYYFNGSGVMQTGWLKSGNKWYFLKNSGAMATGWVKSGGKWYYMNSSGAMQTGWVKVRENYSDHWYYMNRDGSMYTGWLKSGGSWYYLKNSGVMCQSETYNINGKNYHFNNNGVWDR